MKIMQLLIIALLLFVNISAQKIIEKYQPPEGHLRIGPEPERIINMVEKGYTLILPEAGDIKGVVVVPGARKFEVNEYINKNGSLENESLKKNLAVIHVFSGNPLDFYFTNDVMIEIVKNLESVLKENFLSDKPIYFTGLSLAGTRALKLSIFLQRNRSKYWMQPSAVAIVDAPLDMVRLWDAENRAVKNNFHPDAEDEGRWITYLLKENLGTPYENFDKYVEYSPFVYTAEEGGNVKHLRNVPIRAYHAPDVNWWIENHRKDYYSINSVDLAGLINQLKLLHNNKSELITTYQKQADEDSSPHSDSFVDYAELMDWFLSYKK